MDANTDINTSIAINKKSPPKLWLCLHFPDLPIEVFTRDPQDNAVVVTQRRRVAFMNDAARSQGICVGNSMNTAYTMGESLASFERDENREFSTLSQLAQWAYQFTPNVSIKAPGSLLMDITASLSLFGGLESLKSAIHKKLAGLGFTAVIGVNGTPMAAVCFAVAGAGDNTGDVTTSLRNMPVHYLGIDEKIRQGLHQIGINQCHELFALPTDGLTRRYGVYFVDYLKRLTGSTADPQKFITDKPRFRHEITFLSDVTNTASLIFPMKRLLGELQDFLISRQLRVSRFSFRLSHRSHSPRSFSVFLASPDNNANMFLMLSQLQLEKIQIPEVDNLCLAVSRFHEVQEGPEAGSNTDDLFNHTGFKQPDGSLHSKAAETRSLQLINMMAARLGQQSCFGLSLANDHRPERAWKTVPLTGSSLGSGSSTKPYTTTPTTTSGKTADSELVTYNERPLYLLPNPRLLSAPAGIPSMSGRLELLQGPERIEFGWWDDNPAYRDYYIARHPSGSLYWVYQHLDIDNAHWYLHGIFS